MDNFRTFLARVKPDIDQKIAEVLTREHEIDEEVKPLLLKGKRLRGGLLLYVADNLKPQGAGLDWKKALDLAVAGELSHGASLILDDMLDEDLTRRGLPTLHLSRGQKQAMLDTIGILTLPYEIAGKYGDCYTQSLADTQRHMALGVLREMFEIRTRDLPAGSLYDTIITKKTGYGFGLAALWGFMAAKDDVPMIKPWVEMEKWRTWGIHVGKTMQIADDIADLLAVDLDNRGKRSWGSEILLLMIGTEHLAKDLVSDLKDLELHPEKTKLILSHAGVKEALKDRMVKESTAAMMILMKMEMDPDVFKLLGQVPFIIADIMLGEVLGEDRGGHKEREGTR